MDDFKYSGSWYLPNSEKRVSGDLTFSDASGLRLNLDEPFQEKMGDHLIILGVTEEGKSITLYDCLLTNFRSVATELSDGKMLDYKTEGYEVRVAFIGAQFSDAQEMRFHHAQVQYDYLPDFVQRHGFKTNLQTTKEGIPQRYELTYEFPETTVATTPQATITIGYALEREGDLLNGLVLRQSPLLEIEWGMDLTHKELDSQWIHPLRDLISFATKRPNSVTALRVYCKNKVKTLTNYTTGRNYSSEIPIEIFYQQRYHGQRQNYLLSTDKLLFTLQSERISDQLSEVLSNWLDINSADKLADVCNLFFSVLYAPDLYPEMKFLNIAFSAELYHRKRFSNEILPESEHKARVKSIVGSAPAEHREWLNNVLFFSNEPPFRDRIDQLIEETKEVVSPLFSDKDYFVCKVKDTRNYRVHNDPRLETKAAKGEELDWISEVLSFLVQTCLLKELGLSSQECFALFSKNRDYETRRAQAHVFTPHLPE